MPVGKTYVKVASQTLSSASASITFSNLPQNYTDLVAVCRVAAVTAGAFRLYVGNTTLDTGANYSRTSMYGRRNNANNDHEYGSARSTADVHAPIVQNTDIYTSASGAYSPVIANFMNYSNATTYKTIVTRHSSADNASYRGVEANISVWRSTSPITTIQFFTPNGNLASGSSITIYGIECAKNPYATGGDKIYTTGTHWVHEFYNSGLFVPRQNLTADYLVVAGGGGGGSGNATPGGGGGAGGLRSTVTATGGGGSLESALSLTGFTAYTVTVGAGGSGGHSSFDTRGIAGSDSVFSTITSTGGGFGAENQISGGSGGSGGGGAGGVNTSGGTRTASPVQGNNGGGGLASGNQPSGGGGGAGAAGSAGSGSTGGAGGAGVAVAITGSSITYAGGGGGSTYNGGTAGAGGAGGGGAGAYNAAGSPNGTSNTGGGGGGTGGNGGTRYAAGNGGSGVVIVRYAI